MQIFIFRSVCIKLVDLRMNLYQELKQLCALRQEFGHKSLGGGSGPPWHPPSSAPGYMAVESLGILVPNLNLRDRL